jgi:predicted transcriptional regulator
MFFAFEAHLVPRAALCDGQEYSHKVTLRGSFGKMIRFLKNRITQPRQAAQQLSLGRLEFDLMEILWSRGESNVRDVAQRLSRPLAYTTVMTTLDRLYKKGLLKRRMPDRAFLYSARLSRDEWERTRAENILTDFLTGPQASRELLLSSFLDAVGEHDSALLDELEKKIRRKRRELFRRGQP